MDFLPYLDRTVYLAEETLIKVGTNAWDLKKLLVGRADRSGRYGS